MGPKGALENLVSALVLDSQVYWLAYLFMYGFSACQTTSLFVHNDSQIHLVLRWFDFAEYLPTKILLISLGVLSSIFVALSVLIGTKTSNVETQPSTSHKIFVKIVSYGIITLFLVTNVPLLKSSSKMILGGGSEGIILGIWGALVALLIGALGLLHLSINCIFKFSPYSTLTWINLRTMLDISRFIVAIFTAVSGIAVTVATVFCLLASLGITYYRPLGSTRYQNINLIVQSLLLWLMVVRLLEDIYGQPFRLGIFLVGLLLSVASLKLATQYRIQKQIEQLGRDSNNPYGIIIVSYLAQQPSQHASTLALFLHLHMNQCTVVTCSCRGLANSINSSQFLESERWKKLLSDIICQYFSIASLLAMGQTQQRIQVEARIPLYLLRAKCTASKRNSTFLQLSQMNQLIETNNVFSLQFVANRNVFMRYFAEQLGDIASSDSLFDKLANTYVSFQMRLFFLQTEIQKSVDRIVEFWEELLKIQPDTDKIQQIIIKFYRSEVTIKSEQESIVDSFPKADQVVTKIISRYQCEVLQLNQKKGLSDSDPLTNAGFSKNKKLKTSASLKYFSYESETPLCVTEVGTDSSLKIVSANSFFWQFLNQQPSKQLALSVLLPAGSKKNHQAYVRTFVESDRPVNKETHKFMVNSSGNLLDVQIFVQLILSLQKGLLYASFIKVPDDAINSHCLCLSKDMEIVASSFCLDSVASIDTIRDYFRSEKGKEAFSQVGTNVIFDSIEYRVWEVYRSSAADNQLSYLKIDSLVQEAESYQMIATIRNTDTRFSDLHQQKILGEQSLKEDQKKKFAQLREIFFYIDNVKRCQNVTRWGKLIIVGILIVLVVAFVGGFSARLRCSEACDGIETTSKFSKLTSSLVACLQSMRDINLHAQTNSASFVNEQKQLMKSSLDVFSTSFSAFSWLMNEGWIHFKLIPATGKTELVQEKDFVIISKSIQASLNSFLQVLSSQYSFGITLNSNIVPLSEISSNFYQANINGLYTVLPGLQAKRNSFLTPLLNSSFKSSAKEPTLYLFIVTVLLAFTIVTASTWVSQGIVRAKQQTYLLLSRLSEGEIKQRLERALIFLGRSYEKLEEPFPASKASPNLMMSPNSQFQSFDATESRLDDRSAVQTDRQFHRKVVPAKKKPRKESALVFKRKSLVGILMKQIMFAVPLLCLSGVLLGLSLSSKASHLADFDYLTKVLEKSELSRKISLYSIQLGLSIGAPAGASANITAQIKSQLQAFLEIERVLINLLETSQGSRYKSFINIMKIYYTESFCLHLSELKLVPTLTFSFTKDECFSMSTQNFLANGLRSALVGYAKQISVVLELNPNIEKATLETRKAYIENSDIKLGRMLVQYLSRIDELLLEALKDDLHGLFNSSLVTFIGACAGCAAISVAVLIYMRIKLTASLLMKISQARAVLQLVSEELVLRSGKLQEHIQQQVEVYKFLR